MLNDIATECSGLYKKILYDSHSASSEERSTSGKGNQQRTDKSSHLLELLTRSATATIESALESDLSR